MSAKDLAVDIKIPWLPGSSLRIRPMTLADERKLLASPSDLESYKKLVKDCVLDSENFDWDKDYSSMEHAYILAQLRIITYGGEMAISGYKCPHCGFVNSNHLVNLSEYKLYPQMDKIYINLDKSDIGSDQVRIGHPPLKVLKEIEERQDRMAKKKDDKGELLYTEDEVMASFLEMQMLAIFIDYSLDELLELAHAGKLSVYDIKKANHYLVNHPYGYDYHSSMNCHKCKEEFEISLAVLGRGFLVPYFGD